MKPKHDRKPLTDKHINDLIVQAALLLLAASHKVPNDLYAIVEDRNLGPAIIKKAEEQGDVTLLDDAIAQWG